MLYQKIKYPALFRLITSLVLFATLQPVQNVESKTAVELPVTYINEKSIVFETKNGMKTDAFSGFISVPENRDRTDSRLIKVHYVRFAATGNKHGSPIIYLSGGPGGSGINTAKYPNFRFPLFMALREFGDVIALDQRGTGSSDDMPTCKSSQFLPMTKPHTVLQVTKQYRLAAKECVVFWKEQGIDVSGYNTVESANDLNVLRQHFDADKITLWGISYGSHLAFAAMKQFPSKIDKVVIASAEGLNQTVKLPFETDRYFDRLQVAINTQAEAAQQYPNIKRLIKRVHKSLEDTPLLVKLINEDGTEQDFLFQKHHLQHLASAMIADPHRVVGYLLRLYKSLDNGSLDVLNSILERGFFNDNQINFTAMSFGMDIASGITSERLTLVNQQAKNSLLGLALNFPMPQLNDVVTGLDLGDNFRSKPQNDIPTLLLTGTLDGRTYIDSQYQATLGLTNLTKITVINAGHNLFMRSPEVTEVIKAFLSDSPIKYRTITVDLPDFMN